MNEFGHLSFASTLCGKCTEVCPVNINLHELLLINRQELVKFGIVSKKRKTSSKMDLSGIEKKKRMEIANATLKKTEQSTCYLKRPGDLDGLFLFLLKIL